jgi:hypothetical protein
MMQHDASPDAASRAAAEAPVQGGAATSAATSQGKHGATLSGVKRGRPVSSSDMPDVFGEDAAAGAGAAGAHGSKQDAALSAEQLLWHAARAARLDSKRHCPAAAAAAADGAATPGADATLDFFNA